MPAWLCCGVRLQWPGLRPSLGRQEAQAGKPALNKLSHLAELEDMLRRKNLQSDLLDAGVLGVLKVYSLL